MTDYKPNYTPEEIQAERDTPNQSGLSARQNVTIEEAAQRRIALSEQWMLAREINGAGDSKETLERLGFTNLTISDGSLFYTATPPEGWSKSTSGYWTEIIDADGKKRAMQFYKGAWYDERAFINFYD